MAPAAVPAAQAETIQSLGLALGLFKGSGCRRVKRTVEHSERRDPRILLWGGCKAAAMIFDAVIHMMLVARRVARARVPLLVVGGERDSKR